MTIPFFRDGFALPVDQTLLVLLDQEIAKTELNIERLTQLTFNFRNPGYSAEQGDINPNSFRRIAGTQGECVTLVFKLEPVPLEHRRDTFFEPTPLISSF